MKTNHKIIIIFVVIIIFATSWFIWSNLQKKEVQKCGDIVLEGYLVTNCPWQAYPWLEDKKSSYGGNCSLDIWLSESQPEGPIPEICRNINNTGQPLTSKCLLEGITSFDPWGDELDKYPRVTLVGTYKEMKVCNLLRKCPEPECSECSARNVFAPCEVIKK
jgi:hypothetical protein